jgi:SAM-dependent methyltransferase
MNNAEIDALDKLESTHWWYRVRKENLLRWVKSLPRESSVLDLGSASGGNTLELMRAGFSVTSVEYSSHGIALQIAKGIKPIQADARSLPFGPEEFDGVYCMDVLEHIVEDEQVLSQIYRVTVQGGKFLCSVPEDPDLWSAHDVAVDHVRRYTRSELSSKIELAGFRIDRIYSRNTFLRPVIVFMRKFSSGNDLKKQNLVVNFILLLICRFELRFGSNSARGVTLWAECTKV